MENVRVIKPFLNLVKGTELWFNAKSGRYEFKSRDEDSSADFRSVKEHSIHLEPWLVEENIGEYFEPVNFEVLDLEEEPKYQDANWNTKNVDEVLESISELRNVVEVQADRVNKLEVAEPSLCVGEVDVLGTLESLAESLTGLKSMIERLEFITDKHEEAIKSEAHRKDEDKDVVIARIHAETAEKIAKINNS